MTDQPAAQETGSVQRPSIPPLVWPRHRVLPTIRGGIEGLRSAGFAWPAPASEKVLAMRRNGRLDTEGINRRLGLLQRHADRKKLPYANVTARRWFRPNPPLEESDVCRFESEHRVRLPEDYTGSALSQGRNWRCGGARRFFCADARLMLR